MMRGKLAILLVSILILNISSPTIESLADEISSNQVLINNGQAYKPTIENVELLKDNKVEDITATVEKFEYYSNEEYSKLFKMDNKNIKSIKNNGGKYLNQVITRAIDGDLDTYWETNKGNTSDFTNEVEVEFQEEIELNRIVYGARESDNKGFATEFEIYGSTTANGDTYELVAIGKHNAVSGLVEAKFNPTKFKRIKFKFKDSEQNWATLSELAFYKEDKLSDKVKGLFTNGLMTELSTEFNSIDKLKELENEAKGHPLESIFKEDFDLAGKIVRGEDLGNVKIITAEQHGDMVAHAKNNLKFGFGNNNQPTGIAVKPGEKITVYVDAQANYPLPKLAFTQQEGSINNWIKTANLKPGKNVITVPTIPVDSQYKHEVTRGGSIYIVNPYTKKQQPKTPVIRFASGEKYPFLTKDTDVEEFKKFLIEYKKKIDEDIAKNPNVLDRKVLDIFEFVSDHIVWTGTATGAYEAYIKEKMNPLDTITLYNKHMDEIFKYYGLDGSNEKNDPKYIRENVRLAQPYAYMYAASDHIGVLRNVMKSLLISPAGWGLTHEIGHRMDVNVRKYVEVTNNMLPQYMSGYYNNLDYRIPFENKIYKNVLSTDSNKYNPKEYFEALAVFWQLELYKPGYWGKLNKLYRERNISLGNKNPENVKMQYLVKFSSEAIGEDLSEYFARHGFTVNAETKKETSKYKKTNNKIWYLNSSKFDYKGTGFTKDIGLVFSLNNNDDGNVLRFYISNRVDKSKLLGYEILRDGEVIGFTVGDRFIDTNIDKSKNYKYEVVPYDFNLGTGGSVVLNSRDNLATNVYIGVGGVNGYGEKILEGLRVNFDLKDNTIYLTNRLNTSINPGFANKKYFTLRLLDKNKNEKTSISLTGNDRADDPKYNKLNFVKFEIGDFVELEHQEAFRLNISGQEQVNKKAVYRITEKGLEVEEQLDTSIIRVSGSGKGYFELLFEDNFMKLQNRGYGIFATEYTGFNKYYIEVTLKTKDGRIKTKSSIYGSMYAENKELDKLDNVKYEYGDILTISHMSPQYIKLNGPVIGNKPISSTQNYEITKLGFKVIQ